MFPLCRQDIPSILVPSEFFALFEVQTSQEEIIARLADYAFSEIAQRTYFRERNALRSEKERPWGLRTYRTVRGQLQNAKPSFTEMLKIAEEVIDEIEMPTPPKSRGRARRYDWKQNLAALIWKGTLAFSDLERKLREMGYCKVGGRTPVSYTHLTLPTKRIV